MIHFVGAGSGAPDLITVRGKNLLEQADVKKFCTLQCTDGSLQMPAYTLIFEEEKDR